MNIHLVLFQSQVHVGGHQELSLGQVLSRLGTFDDFHANPLVVRDIHEAHAGRSLCREAYCGSHFLCFHSENGGSCFGNQYPLNVRKVQKRDFVGCVIKAYNSLAPVSLGIYHGGDSYQHLVVSLRGFQKVSGSLSVISESFKGKNRAQLAEGRFDHLPKLMRSLPCEDGLVSATEKLIHVLHAEVGEQKGGEWEGAAWEMVLVRPRW